MQQDTGPSTASPPTPEPPAPPPPPDYRSTPTMPPSTGNRPYWPWLVPAIVVAVLVAVWYFGYYDTAGAKCQRGDLGACFVYYAEQSASASAAAVAASQSAAAVQASVESAQFAASGCTVGPADGSHNVRITVSDTAFPNVQQSTCEQLVQSGWAVSSAVDGSSQTCQIVGQDGNTITVNDTGGQYYGQQACQLLNQSTMPSWPIQPVTSPS